MYDLGYQKNRMDEIVPNDVAERRAGMERRKASDRGFTYISTVGWICRREQLRREDDSDGAVDPEP